MRGYFILNRCFSCQMSLRRGHRYPSYSGLKIILSVTTDLCPIFAFSEVKISNNLGCFNLTIRFYSSAITFKMRYSLMKYSLIVIFSYSWLTLRIFDVKIPILSRRIFSVQCPHQQNFWGFWIRWTCSGLETQFKL